MVVLLLIVLVVGMIATAGYLADDRRRQEERARQIRERLRVEHDQFRAEMRLHNLTQSSLQRLLDEARQRS